MNEKKPNPPTDSREGSGMMRKALVVAVFLAAGLSASYGGYRWWDWWIRGIARQEAQRAYYDVIDEARASDELQAIQIRELQDRIHSATQDNQAQWTRIDELRKGMK